ncbi:MAG: response regulator [Gemmobacter sp.]|nr:response regulator [Gemmobacter sp.]
MFRKMVRDLDLDLVFAGNGREAVELFSSFAPDLIFMDISMPEMDGRAATQAIRALEAGADHTGGGHVPIIALTAHTIEGDGAELLAIGMDRYLTKPLRKSAICEVLEAYAPGRLPGTSQVQGNAA